MRWSFADALDQVEEFPLFLFLGEMLSQMDVEFCQILSLRWLLWPCDFPSLACWYSVLHKFIFIFLIYLFILFIIIFLKTPIVLEHLLLFFLNLFIYLFLAVLGFRFCARPFSSCSERGPLFIMVCGPLTVADCRGLSCRGAQAPDAQAQ